MRISREAALMEIAGVVGKRSTCSRLSVGAILARDFRIISSGYNGAPTGLSHCTHDSVTERSQGCKTAVHAEINAVLAAAKYGVAVNGAELYVTHFPCQACAQALINSGISKVYYGAEYRKMGGEALLNEAGILLERLTID